MARTTQKNTVKAAKGPVVAAKLSYNGVALPTDVAERRKMRNKLSAKAHREKKKDALAGAKQEVIACDRELAHLKSELTEVSLICVYIIVILDMQWQDEHNANVISIPIYLQMKTKASALQAIFESIEAKFGVEAVKNIFKQFGDADVPTSIVDTYPLPSAVSSDSDDTLTSDDDSCGYAGI